MLCSNRMHAAADIDLLVPVHLFYEKGEAVLQLS